MLSSCLCCLQLDLDESIPLLPPPMPPLNCPESVSSPVKSPNQEHPTQECPTKESRRKRPISGAAERTKKKRFKSLAALESSSEPIVIDCDERNDGRQVEDASWLRIHGISLPQYDRDTILNGGWLNDRIMHAGMLLMKHDSDLLPVGSLQDPILGETLTFKVAVEESVQILHSGGNHWITISRVGTRHATARIYDSLYGELPWGTKETIASLIHTKERAITLEYANVQVSS